MELSTISKTRTAFNDWLNKEAALQSNLLFESFSSEKVIPKDVLPRKLKGDAYAISCYRDETRWSFLDRVCERISKEGSRFLEDPADRDAIEWTNRLKAIRRDVHKAHAFVRFKKTTEEGKEIFIAWHRPQHLTTDLFIRLFCRRFPTMHWMILTADECAHFENGKVQFSKAYEGQSLEIEDHWEENWRTYYSSIYNPARLMVQAMKKEMPQWHWQTMPESSLIPNLIRQSQNKIHTMAQKSQRSASPYIPTFCQSIEKIQESLPQCEGCSLHAHCRVTPGKGNSKASLLFVGEQPGDEEEKRGEPFIGPAGQLLRKTWEEVGGNWNDLYVTNALKHFKYELRGKMRLHKRPGSDEVAACRPWLQKELELISPKVILCLGSTAALSVSGRLWPVERYRGTWLPSAGQSRILLTYHPAALLRAPDQKKQEYERDFKNDLKLALSVA